MNLGKRGQVIRVLEVRPEKRTLTSMKAMKGCKQGVVEFYYKLERPRNEGNRTGWAAPSPDLGLFGVRHRTIFTT